MTSLAIHGGALLLFLLVASQTVLKSAPPEKQVDIVFYRPPEIAILTCCQAGYAANGVSGCALGAPAPAAHPKANAPAGPDGPGGGPDLPFGPEEGHRTEPQPSRNQR